jgi:hypothetical protein
MSKPQGGWAWSRERLNNRHKASWTVLVSIGIGICANIILQMEKVNGLIRKEG